MGFRGHYRPTSQHIRNPSQRSFQQDVVSDHSRANQSALSTNGERRRCTREALYLIMILGMVMDVLVRFSSFRMFLFGNMVQRRRQEGPVDTGQSEIINHHRQQRVGSA